MYQLKLNTSDKMPKYKQIIQSVINDIERNVLKKNEQLPSISGLSEEYYLSRDTVEKAYRELRKRGFIITLQGKGNYVNCGETRKIRILLVFNKLSSYKKLIYYAFLNTLGEKAVVDLQIHHYNARLFEEIIDKNLGLYNYYVVMPHFYQEEKKAALKILDRIPTNELILLDKDLPDLKNQLSVYQDFERDVFQALETANDLLTKYQRFILIFPGDENHPIEIVRGVRYYCASHDKEFVIKENVDKEILQEKTIYLVLEETDLAELVKKIRMSSFQMGRDIGVISFNDTTLKELLGITVITTDFENMGRTAANLLLENKKMKVKNPFYMIRRETL